MNLVCCYCHAEGFVGEKILGNNLCFGQLCCCGGKIMLPYFPGPPNTLQNLLNTNGNDPDSRYVLQHMREFNSGMSMATIQMKHHRPDGQSMIRIQSQVVRRVGAITTSDMNNSRFIQTYWLESDAEAQRRTSLLVNFSSLQRLDSEKEKEKIYLPNVAQL
jgi:hypothetical protein